VTTIRTVGTGMNNTIACRFCTLREAAERLDATHEQIEDLLRRGFLREFRDGSHRLLRAADVAAIAAVRERRALRQGRPQPSDAIDPYACRGESRSGHDRPDPIRVPQPSAGISQTFRSPRRRAPVTARREDSRFDSADLGDGPASSHSSRRPRSPEVPRKTRGRRIAETTAQQSGLSMREWLWTGLTQDRPMTIALLCAFVLLALSALIAGACMLGDFL